MECTEGPGDDERRRDLRAQGAHDHRDSDHLPHRIPPPEHPDRIRQVLKLRDAAGVSIAGVYVSPTLKLGLRNDIIATNKSSTAGVPTGAWDPRAPRGDQRGVGNDLRQAGRRAGGGIGKYRDEPRNLADRRPANRREQHRPRLRHAFDNVSAT